MVNCCDENVLFFHVWYSTKTKTTFKVVYQYVRGFRTKQTELLHMAFSMDFQIICLTETWLNARCCDHKLFPDSFITFCSDRDSNTTSRDGGILIAISSRVCIFKCRYNLQFYKLPPPPIPNQTLSWYKMGFKFSKF